MPWNRAEKPWFYRRNLPHLLEPDAPIFITFRTFANLHLSPDAPSAVMEHILYENHRRVELHGAIIMPNHVHILFTCLRDESGESYTLSKILNSIKDRRPIM